VPADATNARRETVVIASDFFMGAPLEIKFIPYMVLENFSPKGGKSTNSSMPQG
jgi:hypothetical protein